MATGAGTDTGTKKEEAVAVASDVKDEATGQAKAVVQDAKAAATAVAETTKAQANDLAGQLQGHARTVVGDATSELDRQLGERLQRIAVTTRDRSHELHALAEGRIDDAGWAADFARSAADQLGRMADRAEQLGPRGVAEEAAHFARRRPLAFLAGAVAAGFVVGRLVRNSGQSEEGGGNGASDGRFPYADAVPALPAEGATMATEPAVPPTDVLAAPGPTHV